MKRITWFAALAALLVSCSGLAAAQCAGVSSPGGFDLLSTFSGTQDTNPNSHLSAITFDGMTLPGGLSGSADTIVCRKEALPSQIPPGGTTLDIQIVALLLKGDGTYTDNNRVQHQVTVYATINQTQDSNGVYKIPNDYNDLPQPDTLDPSIGTMTVTSDGKFNTISLKVEADLIVVPQGELINSTNRLAVLIMNEDTISSSGSTWTTTPPAGYPNSTTFPSGGFYVNQPGGGAAVFAPLVTSRIFRGSLFAFGLLLVGIAILRLRSSVKSGRLSLQPIYLMGLAALAWFVGWKSNRLGFPMVAHAAATVVPITTCVPHTISAWVNEGNGQFVVHKIVTAVCTGPQAKQL